MSEAKRAKSTRAGGVVSLAVMCSRVLGLLRELVFAALFGAGDKMDAFVAAFRAPNLLRDLFAEGALSTAFVTTFSKKIEKEGDRSAWLLANKVATLTVIFMSAVTLLGVLFAPALMSNVLARGYSGEKLALSIQLTRIMFPFILVVSLAALAMGMLNAKDRFGVPALASSFFNLGSIIGGTGLGYWLDPAFGERALIGLALGTLIGGFLQFAVQCPSLYRVGFRFRPDFRWRDEGVRKILQLMGPAVIAASAVQVNVMVNGMFASYLGEGPMSWLNYAFRLMQLPIGVFGVAIGMVTLPAIARSASRRDAVELRDTLSHAIRLAFLLTLPSAAGLIIFSEPIISLIFERGAFTSADTVATAAALQFYAAGLVAYAAIKVLAPAFYAMDRRWEPMLVSFFSIATNLLLNWFFTFHLEFGHRGLALSTGLVATINFLILYGLMVRHADGMRTPALIWTLLRLLVAVIPLAAICWVAREYLLVDLATMGLLEKAVKVIGSIGVAAAAFFGCVFLLGIEEMRDLVNMFRKRFRGGPVR